MPTLDSCINDRYEPGNIGSSIGTTPAVITKGSLYPPDTFPWGTFTSYSHSFNFYYNSFLHHHRVR